MEDREGDVDRRGRSTNAGRTAFVVLTLSLALTVPFPIRAQPTASEADVEVVMIERIAHFVVWPEAARLEDPRTTFEVVVLGSGRMYPRLRAMFARSGAERRTRVRQVQRIEDIGLAHVLYIEDDWTSRAASVVARLGTTPVLTIGHAPCLASLGVTVNLYRDGPNLRFEVNRDALARSGLRASFHLLRLAQAPREGCR